jgi:hypothetical protein
MCYDLDRMSAQELVLQIQDGYRRRTPFVLTKGFRRVYPQTDALSLRIRERHCGSKRIEERLAQHLWNVCRVLNQRGKEIIPNSRCPPGSAKVPWPLEDRRLPTRTRDPRHTSTPTPTLGLETSIFNQFPTSALRLRFILLRSAHFRLYQRLPSKNVNVRSYP